MLAPLAFGGLGLALGYQLGRADAAMERIAETQAAAEAKLVSLRTTVDRLGTLADTVLRLREIAETPAPVPCPSPRFLGALRARLADAEQAAVAFAVPGGGFASLDTASHYHEILGEVSLGMAAERTAFADSIASVERACAGAGPELTVPQLSQLYDRLGGQLTFYRSTARFLDSLSTGSLPQSPSDDPRG